MVWCSIVYDAGTSAESYEWLTVQSCPPDELRILEEKVNVLEIPKPPSAQARTPHSVLDCATLRSALSAPLESTHSNRQQG